MSDQSTPGPEGTSEQLTSEGGTPSGGGGKRGLVIGGAVAAVAVVGGAAWAATSFLGQGAQPAEALPAATLGYASVDLDPSGSQKVEALEVLRKFPAIEKELDLGADDDLREKLFTEMTSSCDGVDYAADVEPWLGNRAAVAAVDVDGKPAPVVVLQHSDAAAAEDGLAAIEKACGGEDTAYDVGDEWILVGESDDALAAVTGLVDKGTLADDEDFQRWTGEAGEPGIVTMYAAPEAGEFLAKNAGDLFGSHQVTESSAGTISGASPEVPPEVKAALEEFEGAAATLRFSDGSLELESALGAGKQAELVAGSGQGGSVVGALPQDTAVAIGLGLTDGWTDKMLDQIASSSGGQMTKDQLAQELESTVGITVDELETLFGDALAVALGPDFDVREMVNSSDPSSLPVGVKITGDADAIEEVLGKVRTSMGPQGEMLESESEGDVVAVSPNPDYRKALADDGGLRDSAVFDEVVEGGDDAAGVLYVNFDAGDGAWLEGLAAGDPTIEKNLAPLSAFGVSSRVDDDVTRFTIRLTTD